MLDNFSRTTEEIILDERGPAPLCGCHCGEPASWNVRKKQWNRFANQKHAARVLGLSKRKHPKPIPNHHLCGCGFCDILVASNMIYAVGHNTKNKPTVIPNHHLCECKHCDIMVPSNRRFAKGHNGYLTKHDHNGEKNPFYNHQHKSETKDLLSKIFTGKYIDTVHPNLGKKHLSEENFENYSKAAKKRWLDPDYAEAIKKSLSIINSGEGNPMFGVSPSIEVCENHSAFMKNKWLDEEYIQKQYTSRAMKPNKAEAIILWLLELLFPGEYRYTGDFSFTINGKPPDFTNINGQKKVIELFGDYWHAGEDPQIRINMFKEFGYDCLVVWEHELKDIEAVKYRLIEFHNKANIFIRKINRRNLNASGV